ncbi:MAG: hypothetical protein ABW076_09200 [Candidatus Thiodiazotropha sp.]
MPDATVANFSLENQWETLLLRQRWQAPVGNKHLPARVGKPGRSGWPW